MVRLTDRPDMTLDVYLGRKTTMQRQQQLMCRYMYTKHVCNRVKPVNVVTFIKDHLSYAATLSGSLETKYRAKELVLSGHLF